MRRIRAQSRRPRISSDIIACITIEATGRPISYRERPIEEQRELLQAAGESARIIDLECDLYSFYGTEVTAAATDTLERILRRPTTSFADFARHLAPGPANAR